jgi:hypothetical protein
MAYFIQDQSTATSHHVLGYVRKGRIIRLQLLLCDPMIDMKTLALGAHARGGPIYRNG